MSKDVDMLLVLITCPWKFMAIKIRVRDSDYSEHLLAASKRIPRAVDAFDGECFLFRRGDFPLKKQFSEMRYNQSIHEN
jgi:hypothetical protein